MLVQATNGNNIGISTRTKFRWSHTAGKMLHLNTSTPISFFPLPFSPPPFLFSHSLTHLSFFVPSPLILFPHPSFSLSLVYWLAGPEFGTWRVHPWYPSSFAFAVFSPALSCPEFFYSVLVWNSTCDKPCSPVLRPLLGAYSPISTNSYINKADHSLPHPYAVPGMYLLIWTIVWVTSEPFNEM